MKSKFRYIIFKEDNIWYSVALDFSIVESGKNVNLAFLNLRRAVDGYVKSSKKIKDSNYQFLNQKPDLSFIFE